MTEIFAKHYLGLSQVKEIIDWAYDTFTRETDCNENFIKKLAFLEKTDTWEIAKAEEIFFEYHKMNNDEILVTIKRYFLILLEEIVLGKRNLFELVDVVIRIRDKYQQPKWINELNSFCVYLMPDSTLIADSRLEIEMNKTIRDLKLDLKVR